MQEALQQNIAGLAQGGAPAEVTAGQVEEPAAPAAPAAGASQIPLMPGFPGMDPANAESAMSAMQDLYSNPSFMEMAQKIGESMLQVDAGVAIG